MNAIRGMDSAIVDQGGRFKLFVEGDEPDGRDSTLLKSFLQPLFISVHGLGSCTRVRAAAEALHAHHPEYMFVIDRDHLSDEQVENSWLTFSNSGSSNLLVWRKREIESYLIDPNFLIKSPLISCDIDELRGEILKIARNRVYFDIANCVITSIRAKLTMTAIEQLTSPDICPNFMTAKNQVMEMNCWGNEISKVSSIVDQVYIAQQLDLLKDKFLGVKETPEFGHGEWINLMKARPFLNEVINRFGKCQDIQGNNVIGKELQRQVFKSLMRISLDEQHADLQQLYRLIETKMKQ